jgi:phosphoribosylamine---glycine ligase
MANVLLIGGGGREHALAWALKKSARVENLWCAPGNAGIEAVAHTAPLDWRRRDALLAFLKEKHVDLTVIGPEAPLVEGVADWIREAGGRVFGPGRAAAVLEGSKVFAKTFMKSCGIPTAPFEHFSYGEEALGFVKSSRWRPELCVVKASGLAAGKGVRVCENREEVVDALEEMMVKKVFGAAGDQVVLEERLEGEELSVMALCDGSTVAPLPPSQDHKRVFDGDQGPNTGGMGAYAPVPQLTEATWKEIEKSIFRPFLQGLSDKNLDYCGVIYFGLMLTPQGPRVLEFNVRFGDPETQAVVPLVENDWLDVFEAAASRELNKVSLRQRQGAAVTVVMASEGYPGAFKKGQKITGLPAPQPDLMVFHAGTARESSGDIVTAGGRVLAVTGLGPDWSSAREKAYGAARSIRFEGAHFRTDIAARALARAGLQSPA